MYGQILLQLATVPFRMLLPFYKENLCFSHFAIKTKTNVIEKVKRSFKIAEAHEVEYCLSIDYGSQTMLRNE